MKHWVFDLDGTLIDSYSIYMETVTAVFERFGVSPTSIDPEKSRKLFARDFLSLYLPERHVDEAYRDLLASNLKQGVNTKVFDGILDLLASLKENGIAISVWTGREKETTADVLQHTTIHQYIDRFVTGGCVPKNKPHPDGLLKILQEAKNHKDEVIMIGDSDFDVQGARAAQVKSISVSWGNPYSDALAGVSDYHFRTVPELKAWSQQFSVTKPSTRAI